MHACAWRDGMGARHMVDAINARDEDRVVRLIQRQFPWRLNIDALVLRVLPEPDSHLLPHSAALEKRSLGQLLINLHWPKAMRAFAKTSVGGESRYLGLAVEQGSLPAVQSLLEHGCDPNGALHCRPVLNIKNGPQQGGDLLTPFLSAPGFDPWALVQMREEPAIVHNMDYGQEVLEGFIQSVYGPAKAAPLQTLCLPAACVRVKNRTVAERLLQWAHINHLTPPESAAHDIWEEEIRRLSQNVLHVGAVAVERDFLIYKSMWDLMKTMGMPGPSPQQVERLLSAAESKFHSIPQGFDRSGAPRVLAYWCATWENAEVLEGVVQAVRQHHSQAPETAQLQSQWQAVNMQLATPQASAAPPSRRL